MKTIRFISTTALLVLAALAAPAAFAQSASGNYQFAPEDGRTKYVEFDARGDAAGGATGRMFFSDDAEVTEQNPDDSGEPVQTYNGFHFSAEFDGMVVVGGRAVMSGTVRDSSIRGLVGRRVLLTVEDNGDDPRVPDRVTWGVYDAEPRGWTPSDSERDRDPGVGTSWTASDFEREDDPGVRMPRADSITTQSFPVSSYEFFVPASESGNIVVRP